MIGGNLVFLDLEQYRLFSQKSEIDLLNFYRILSEGGKNSVKINLLGTAPSIYMWQGTAPSRNNACSKKLRVNIGRAPSIIYQVIEFHIQNFP